MEPGVIVALVSIAATFGVVVGALVLGAYKARLAEGVDRAELGEAAVEATLVRIEALEAQVERLTERADFTDRLLESGSRRQDDPEMLAP